MQFISYNSDDDSDDDDDNEGCSESRSRVDDKENKQRDFIPITEVEADFIPITDLDGSDHTAVADLRVAFPTKWSVHDDSDDDSGDNRSNNHSLDQESNADGSNADHSAVVMNAMELLSSVTSAPKFLSSYRTEQAFVLPTVINTSTSSLHETTVGVVASDHGQHASMKDQGHAHIKQQMEANIGGLGGKASSSAGVQSIAYQTNNRLHSKQKGTQLHPSSSGTNNGDKDSKEITAKVEIERGRSIRNC